MSVKIYVEGAGQTDLERRECRQAFARFFERAGLAGRLPRTIPCGGRDAAYRNFVTALRTRRVGDMVLLLVDSEEPVTAASAWDHLRQRDRWEPPEGTQDNHAFLMVQVMESWFVADLDSLEGIFGEGFRRNVFPAWPNLEQVAKLNILETLDTATRNCRRKYKKGSFSFEILEAIDPTKVKAASSHARALLDHLATL